MKKILVILLLSSLTSFGQGGPGSGGYPPGGFPSGGNGGGPAPSLTYCEQNPTDPACVANVNTPINTDLVFLLLAGLGIVGYIYLKKSKEISI